MIKSSVAFYPCKSISQTERFYAEIIGLDCVFKTTNVRIFSCGSGYFGFVEYEGDIAPDNRICLSLNCENREDVDREFERMVRLGAAVRSNPSQHPSQPVYSFFLYDPDGYLVEFQKIDDMDL